MTNQFIYKVVTVVDNRLNAELFNSVEELTKKYEQIGVVDSPHLREELQGQPRLDGLHGAMYDGVTVEGKVFIRYESQEAYNRLSV